jgi:hypothetical protein
VPAKIGFPGGAEVTVMEDADEVVKRLADAGSRTLAGFKMKDGSRDVDVHVRPEHVAYVEQIPEYRSAGFG